MIFIVFASSMPLSGFPQENPRNRIRKAVRKVACGPRSPTGTRNAIVTTRGREEGSRSERRRAASVVAAFVASGAGGLTPERLASLVASLPPGELIEITRTAARLARGGRR
jgi:hypothetical protein